MVSEQVGEVCAGNKTSHITRRSPPGLRCRVLLRNPSHSSSCQDSQYPEVLLTLFAGENIQQLNSVYLNRTVGAEPHRFIGRGVQMHCYGLIISCFSRLISIIVDIHDPSLD